MIPSLCFRGSRLRLAPNYNLTIIVQLFHVCFVYFVNTRICCNFICWFYLEDFFFFLYLGKRKPLCFVPHEQA